MPPHRRPPRPPPPHPTHFLALPLLTPTTTPQLRASLAAFKADPLTRSTIPEGAIRPLGTLHLTLGVMTLNGPARAAQAVEFLRGLDLVGLLMAAEDERGDGGGGGEVLGSSLLREEESEKGKERGKEVRMAPQQPLEIILKGLTPMHSPESTSILYAPPYDPNGKLLRFGQSLLDAFVSAGIIILDSPLRPLLLHATVVNTVYVLGVRSAGGGGHGKRKTKLTLDVREVVGKWEEQVWMEGRVEKVAICRMGAKKVDDGEMGEEYIVEGEVDLPG